MPNLAVVGAGIGGCSAAYFARRFLPGTNVTIFESQDRIGGRILTYNAAGMSLELGATFFNGFNRTLFDIVNAERLKIAPTEERVDFAVWNGSELVFRSKKQAYITILKLLAKYKLSLARAYLLLRRVRGQVSKIYQEELGNPSDMGEIFGSVGLYKWSEKTFLEALIENDISQAFIEDILTPVTRSIYSQGAELGGFAGISSLIGVYSGATHSLAEGNSALPARLAEASNAAIKIGQKVDVIEKTPNGSYRVYTGKDIAVFDSVIIATPLELADIRFDGLGTYGWEPQPYQVVFRSVMRGVFSPGYFGLESSAEPPAYVLTTKEAGPITQYIIQKIGHGESLVTISSSEPLDHEAFKGVFKRGEVSVLEHCWKAAYPVFKPVSKLPLTRFDERLMYLSALEPSVSSMETSAFSALNAVRMLGES